MKPAPLRYTICKKKNAAQLTLSRAGASKEPKKNTKIYQKRTTTHQHHTINNQQQHMGVRWIWRRGTCHHRPWEPAAASRCRLWEAAAVAAIASPPIGSCGRKPIGSRVGATCRPPSQDLGGGRCCRPRSPPAAMPLPPSHHRTPLHATAKRPRWRRRESREREGVSVRGVGASG